MLIPSSRLQLALFLAVLVAFSALFSVSSLSLPSLHSKFGSYNRVNNNLILLTNKPSRSLRGGAFPSDSPRLDNEIPPYHQVSLEEQSISYHPQLIMQSNNIFIPSTVANLDFFFFWQYSRRI